MSEWRPTGQASWDEDGRAVYHVTKGQQEASAGDVEELQRIFDSHDELVAALEKVASFAAGQVCAHEEAHRGGAIWEICDYCGAKWADDEGGKPPFEEPEALRLAWITLYRAKGEQP